MVVDSAKPEEFWLELISKFFQVEACKLTYQTVHG